MPNYPGFYKRDFDRSPAAVSEIGFEIQKERTPG